MFINLFFDWFYHSFRRVYTSCLRFYISLSTSYLQCGNEFLNRSKVGRMVKILWERIAFVKKYSSSLFQLSDENIYILILNFEYSYDAAIVLYFSLQTNAQRVTWSKRTVTSAKESVITISTICREKCKESYTLMNSRMWRLCYPST